MVYSVKTDIGLKRETNEDSAFGLSSENYNLFIVADGMGGHLAGEVASSMAVDLISDYVRNNFKKARDYLKLVKASIVLANEEIYKKSVEDEKLDNMGTTCDLCLLVGNQLYVGHVGDSRVYRLSKGELVQLTRDHSLYNEMVDSGSVSEEEASKIARKNIITRALGGEELVEVDLILEEVENEDIILLCTDGLTGGVSDQEIQEVLESDKSLDEMSQRLIEMSNEAGGLDNTTLAIVEVIL